MVGEMEQGITRGGAKGIERSGRESREGILEMMWSGVMWKVIVGRRVTRTRT